MKGIKIGTSELIAPAIALGCMRINALTDFDVEALINTSIENGINFFDHADIYGGGNCEERFGENYKGKREDIIIQTKCGIRKYDNKSYFDFSKEHILKSVDESLKKLKTDYIDILLLHRPDILVEPEEVAEAFWQLSESGKVQNFGVSNQNPAQIQLLNKYLKNKIIANQLQFSAMFTGLVDSGVNVNMKNESSIVHDSSILDYCRLNDITIQAWSPYQYGMFEGVFIANPKFPELNKTIDHIAEQYDVTSTVIATAWILRHPANMQVIVGTTNKDRLKDISKASDIVLTRKQWYEIYVAAGNKLP